MTILLLGRDSRYKQRLCGIFESVQSEAKKIIILAEKNGIDEKLKQNRKVTTYFISDTQKSRSENVIKNLKKTADSKIFLPVSNYVLYASYISCLGLKYKNKFRKNNFKDWVLCALNQVSKILKNNNPDLIIHETLDRPESFFLEKMRPRRCLMLEVRFSALGPLALAPAVGFSRRNPLLEQGVKITKQNLKKSKKILREASKILKSEYHSWHKNAFPQKICHYLKRFFLPFFENRRTTKGFLKFRILTFLNLLKYRSKILNKIPNEKSITYFLNHLPEASTFSEAPNYHDPINICISLCLNKPMDTNIWLKEHPRTQFRRPDYFYKKVLSLPGISLLNSNLDNIDIIKKTDAVLVVTGSIGMQAGALNKPVGVLGRPAWSKAPWVTELNTPEEIFLLPQKKQASFKQKAEFLAKYLATTTPLNFKQQIPTEYEIGKAVGTMALTTYKKIQNDYKKQ